MSALAKTRPGRVFWRSSVPMALATEAGAVVTVLAGIVPGLVAAAVVVLGIGILARVWLPPGPLLRGLLLVSGPPLRYALLALAAWRLWAAQGPLPALAVVALLGLVLPLAAMAGSSYLTRRYPWWSGDGAGGPEEVDG